MLTTPFGNLLITLDDKPIDFEIIQVPANQRYYSNIDKAYRLYVSYKKDNNEHILKCFLETEIECDIESGEHLDAITFYKNSGKLTIGCTSDFGIPEEGDFDFDGEYLSNGLEIIITPLTESQIFVFGISWILNCTDKNDIQTWLASDPFYTK